MNNFLGRQTAKITVSRQKPPIASKATAKLANATNKHMTKPLVSKATVVKPVSRKPFVSKSAVIKPTSAAKNETDKSIVNKTAVVKSTISSLHKRPGCLGQSKQIARDVSPEKRRKTIASVGETGNG